MPGRNRECRHLAGADAGRPARGARHGQERRAAALSVVAKAQEVIEAHQASFARAVAAGVKVAMGTDSGVGPHGSNLDELSLMAAGGMTPSDVLVATTSSAAQLLGLADQTGSLTPGKRADVVVVAGDPFDLAALRQNIRAVYKDGRAVHGRLA
jgi:imidazolonepropionase-like amidohydrolase